MKTKRRRSPFCLRMTCNVIIMWHAFTKRTGKPDDAPVLASSQLRARGKACSNVTHEPSGSLALQPYRICLGPCITLILCQRVQKKRPVQYTAKRPVQSGPVKEEEKKKGPKPKACA